MINLIGKQKKMKQTGKPLFVSAPSTRNKACVKVYTEKEYSWKGCKKPVYTLEHCFSVFKTETKFFFNNNYQKLIAQVKVLFIIIF